MTNAPEQIEIPLSKKKLILSLVGSIAFVAIGLWLIINHQEFGDNPTLVFVVGLASVLFFGLCSVYIARKLPDNKPGLIIDNIALTDNSSAVPAGQILWSDIEDISVIRIHTQKLIKLQVKNPQKYINKQTSWLKRKIMQMNLSMFGTPIIISSVSLQVKFNDLLKILYEKLNASRQ
jgi:hypothetical protein